MEGARAQPSSPSVGTSVVSEVEPSPDSPTVVTIDMAHLNQVLEIGPVSRAALAQEGAQ